MLWLVNLTLFCTSDIGNSFLRLHKSVMLCWIAWFLLDFSLQFGVNPFSECTISVYVLVTFCALCTGQGKSFLWMPTDSILSFWFTLFYSLLSLSSPDGKSFVRLQLSVLFFSFLFLTWLFLPGLMFTACTYIISRYLCFKEKTDFFFFDGFCCTGCCKSLLKLHSLHCVIVLKTICVTLHHIMIYYSM